MPLAEERELRDEDGNELGYDPYCITLEGTGAAIGVAMGAR